MLKIQDCKYVDGYQLQVIFDNGDMGVANLQDEVTQEPYIVLRDINTFKRFYVDHGAVCWQDGKIDMALEYLFFLVNKDKSELQPLFKKWGYI